MYSTVESLIQFLKKNDGIANKQKLVQLVQDKFSLVKDRSVYYSDHFAIRFSYSSSKSFSNTVISLSNLQKFDELPFIVCLVTPNENILYLANSTFLIKVSHSSQELRIDNIRGSINGSDISKEFNGIKNAPENFDKLFAIHQELGFAENLPRLVEATNNISPTGHKFDVNQNEKKNILEAPVRSERFVVSNYFNVLKAELDDRVEQYKDEILIAGFIENVNIRGRIIEYLIAGDDEELRGALIEALNSEARKIPRFKTENTLADYTRIFDDFKTATDVKTKVLILNSNPKGYNIDKMLEYLSKEDSVFLFYFVGIEPGKIINQVLVSAFQKDLLSSTILLKHWAGRNSRGVTQFEGSTLNKIITNPNNEIDIDKSQKFLSELIDM